jgi:predicted tellurium resistance membrane protein TerC
LLARKVLLATNRGSLGSVGELTSNWTNTYWAISARLIGPTSAITLDRTLDLVPALPTGTRCPDDASRPSSRTLMSPDARGSSTRRVAPIGRRIREATLLEEFDWVRYVFGVIVVVAGLRMARGGESVHPDRNLLIRATRRFIPVTSDYQGDRFLVQRAGRWIATPLLIVLVAVESTDIVFATDSIPAVFGVTTDVFIVFTSNAFAVLGLRALYFVFADVVDRFTYLKYGLAVILVFVGIKLLLASVIELPIVWSLGVIAVAIAVSVAVSLTSTGHRPGGS